MELQDLFFALLNFDLALVQFITTSFSAFWNGVFTLCHRVLEVSNFGFDFYKGSQLRVCLKSQWRRRTRTFTNAGTVNTELFSNVRTVKKEGPYRWTK